MRTLAVESPVFCRHGPLPENSFFVEASSLTISTTMHYCVVATGEGSSHFVTMRRLLGWWPLRFIMRLRRSSSQSEDCRRTSGL